MKRQIMVLTVAIIVVSSVFAGGRGEKPTAGVSEVAAVTTEYQEAPMLAELVKAGKLPPLEQRLPKEPFVVGPGVLMEAKYLDWEPGKYSDILRTQHSGMHGSDFASNIRDGNNEPILMAPGMDTQGIRPNLVSEFSASNDNKVFTFRIREGLKWSDGTPVTTDDVSFAVQDVMLNPKLTPSVLPKYRSGGKSKGTPLKLDVIDKYSFTISFDEQYGAFPAELALVNWEGYQSLIKPKHFLARYHATYTPLSEMKAELEKANLHKEEWWVLFRNKDVTHWEISGRKAIGFPALSPWVATEDSGGVKVFTRNPYYFRVDTNGKQLPYFDYVYSYIVQDDQMLPMRIAAGEVDFEVSRMEWASFLKENAEKGRYTIRETLQQTSLVTLYLNYLYEDATWNQVVTDVRFRQALDAGINKKAIADAFFWGSGIPSGWTYDPEKANRLLDEMGMNRRDAHGHRLAPNGKPLSILVEAANWPGQDEMIVADMQKLGLDASLKMLTADLRGTRANANQLMATIGWCHAPTWRNGTWRDYLPPWWGAAVGWGTWYTSAGKEGSEPPNWVKELFAIHEDIMAVIPYSPEFNDAFAKMDKWQVDNIPYIMVSVQPLEPVIASKRLGNVQHSGYKHAGKLAMEQLFFKN